MKEPDIDPLEASCELTINNRLGLHARAAARLVETVQKHQSEVTLSKGSETVDATSILSLLTLECPLGAKVIVSAKGPDADRVLKALTELFDNKFGEE